LVFVPFRCDFCAHDDIQAAGRKRWGKGLSWTGGRGVWVVDVRCPFEFSEDFYTYRACVCNLDRALVERFHEPGVLARKRYQAGKETDESVLLWDIAFHLADTVGDLSGYEVWEDDKVSKSYSGGKRQIYERTFRDMPATYSPWWAKVTPFVKIEKYTFYDKINRIPRPIQPRSMTYRAYLSKYMKPIEDVIKTIVLPGCKFPFMAKGKSSKALAIVFEKMWNRFKKPIAFSLDLAKCDGTIHSELKRLENRFYTRFSQDPRFLACLIAQEADEYVVTIKELLKIVKKWVLKHGRCSGDPQTGCGNTLIMGLVCRAIFRFKIEIFANGDDTIVIMEDENLPLARKLLCNFALFGLDVKEESCTNDLQSVEWCQSKFTITQQGPMWIRNYKKVLGTILANVEYEPLKIRSLMSQIALAELYQNPGQPIVAPVCAWIISHMGTGKRYKFAFNQHTLKRSKYLDRDGCIDVPSLKDRELFCVHAQITPTDQIALENRIIGELKKLVGSQVKVTDWDQCIRYGLHPHSNPIECRSGRQ